MNRRHFVSFAGASLALGSPLARAQERFSLFVGSDARVVARMIELAGLRDGETVIDLGSGDGRIVLAAAQAYPNVRGIGVDLDRALVDKANDAARGRGLANRVQFLHQNAFDADVGKADVIFMWLFPELMRLLRPKILEEARAGARLVAASWDMGSWAPDASDDRGGMQPALRKWIIPAKIEAGWEWDVTLRGRTHRFLAVFEQRMQTAEGVVRVANRREVLRNVILRGEILQFTLRMTLPGTGYTDLTYMGQVRGDTIVGKAVAMLPRPGDDEGGMEEIPLEWNAKKVTPRGFFAPTGTDLK